MLSIKKHFLRLSFALPRLKKYMPDTIQFSDGIWHIIIIIRPLTSAYQFEIQAQRYHR
jgi:hypothetical protein